MAECPFGVFRPTTSTAWQGSRMPCAPHRGLRHEAGLAESALVLVGLYAFQVGGVIASAKHEGDCGSHRYQRDELQRPEKADAVGHDAGKEGTRGKAKQVICERQRRE